MSGAKNNKLTPTNERVAKGSAMTMAKLNESLLVSTNRNFLAEDRPKQWSREEIMAKGVLPSGPFKKAEIMKAPTPIGFDFTRFVKPTMSKMERELASAKVAVKKIDSTGQLVQEVVRRKLVGPGGIVDRERLHVIAAEYGMKPMHVARRLQAATANLATKVTETKIEGRRAWRLRLLGRPHRDFKAFAPKKSKVKTVAPLKWRGRTVEITVTDKRGKSERVTPERLSALLRKALKNK